MITLSFVEGKKGLFFFFYYHSAVVGNRLFPSETLSSFASGNPAADVKDLGVFSDDLAGGCPSS